MQPQESLETTIRQLRELQAHRCACIRACTRSTNATKAHIRRVLGFDTTLAEVTRKEMVTRSQRVYSAIVKGKALTDDREKEAAKLCGAFVLAMRAGIEPIEAYRTEVEKRMERLAADLPAAEFAQSVCGFGIKRLAVIVGEAGDLSGYENPGKVWKRFGLAPKEAYRDVTDKGEECFKIPRRRRSEMWVIGDCLIKSNGKDGEYYGVYAERKAVEREKNARGSNRQAAMHAARTPKGRNVWTLGKVTPEAARKFYVAYDAAEAAKKASIKPATVEPGEGVPMITPMHILRRSQRYMEKRLLRELWKAWNNEHGDGQFHREAQDFGAVPV